MDNIFSRKGCLKMSQFCEVSVILRLISRGKIRVKDFKYVVICGPIFSGHVIGHTGIDATIVAIVVTLKPS